jgi:hypothetical protein
MEGIVVDGWLPVDFHEEWDRRLANASTRGELNVLAPWIGVMSTHASKSKSCSEAASRMKTSFNLRTAELRQPTKGGAK